MSNQPPTELPFADIYIDESSQTGHRYLVLGGIIVSTKDVGEATAAIIAARQPELPEMTMKWSKVSRTKLVAYKRVVDALFDLNARMTLDYHCLVVDTTKQKHGIYNKGSREIGFNKELYQLAMKFGRLYEGLFHVYPDRRSTDQTTEDLRLMLNRGIKGRWNDKRDWPFRRLHFRDPETCQILQAVDILTGALASRLNGHHLTPGASPAKAELSAYVMQKAGIADVFRDTPRGARFTIWHRRLR